MLSAFLVLLSGTAMAQLITLAASPLLTRLYSPDSFGVLGGVLAISSVIASFLHGRMNLAIAKQATVYDKQEVLAAALFLMMSLSACGVVLGYGLKVSGLTTSGVLIYPAISFAFLMSALDMLNYYNGSMGLHRYSAKTAVIRALFVTGLQVAFGLFFITSSGAFLVVGVVCGAAVGLVFNSFLLKKEGLFEQLLQSNLSVACKRIKDNYSYVLFSAPQGALAALSLNSVPILFSFFFSMSAVGHYWLAYRILLAPIGLVGGAYRQAVYPILAKVELCSYAKLKVVARHGFLLAIASVAVATVLLMFGGDIFAFIFGGDWRRAGEYAGWMAICFGLDLAKIPTVLLVQAHSYHKLMLIYEVVLAVARISAIVCFSFVGDIEAVIAFALISSLFSVGLMVVFPLYFRLRLASNC